MKNKPGDPEILSLLTIIISIPFGLVLRFTPKDFFLKDVSAFYAIVLWGLAFFFIGICFAKIVKNFFKPILWKVEKKWVRKFKFRIHWSFGFLISNIIIAISFLIGGIIVYLSFDLNGLMNINGGLLQIVSAWFITCFGMGFGWAIFELHTKIAKIKKLILP